MGQRKKWQCPIVAAGCKRGDNGLVFVVDLLDWFGQK